VLSLILVLEVFRIKPADTANLFGPWLRSFSRKQGGSSAYSAGWLLLGVIAQ
jgi:hypothetical protein